MIKNLSQTCGTGFQPVEDTGYKPVPQFGNGQRPHGATGCFGIGSKPSRLLLAAFLFLLPTAACNIDYYLHLTFGELAQLGRMISLEQALADPNLTPTELEKLKLVRSVRQFGIDRIGLVGDDVFTQFDPNGSQPAAYVITASAKDSFTPFQWSFPFVGVVAYKGFFDKDVGQPEADSLVAKGFDVLYSRVSGFSTLGVFPDPIRQSNLSMDDLDLAELILHEMTHSTVFKPSDTDFNEAMATFVGRSATQRWFDESYGPDSQLATDARNRYSDMAVIDDYVVALFNEVNRYYTESAAAGMTSEQIIAGREAVFQQASSKFATDYEPRLIDAKRWSFMKDLQLDNVRIQSAVRYQGGLSDFEAVFEKTHGSFPDSIAVYREAIKQKDSREYLQQWAATH